MFVERTVAPSYKDLANCLLKALRVGILERRVTRFVINRDWYRLIHAADNSADNEIESMLEFQESFLKKEWDEQHCIDWLLTKEDYDVAIGAMNSWS